MTLAHRTEPIRVLYVLDALHRGGKERQALELIKGIQRSQQGRPVIASMHPRNDFVEDTNSLEVPIEVVTRSVRWDPSVFLSLGRVIRRHKPHVVHTFCTMTSFYCLPLCRMMGIPLVNGAIRTSFGETGLRGLMERGLLRASDAVIANSLAGLASRRLAADSARAFVVHNGFDATRVAVTGPFFRAQGKKIVGMVASFSDYKDYDTYFQAAEKILDKRNDVAFIAVGGGKHLERCRALYERRDNSVQLLGSRSDVERIVPSFSVGVLSTFSEGISNAVMEYMAFGKPVVVTDGGGSSEIVIDGKTGFLVPPKDPARLAESIEFLLNNPGAAARMGEAGKDQLMQRFSLDALVERTMNVYEVALRNTSQDIPLPRGRGAHGNA